jgi:hypothetical protein
VTIPENPLSVLIEGASRQHSGNVGAGHSDPRTTPGRELHLLKSSAFHGALLGQLSFQRPPTPMQIGRVKRAGISHGFLISPLFPKEIG